MKPLIVALGSTVMTDDAIGHYILNRLKTNEEIDADFVDLDTDIFRLRLHYKGQQTIIVLDALSSGGKPGTVLSFSSGEFQEKLEGFILNSHMIGSIEGLKIMQTVDDNLKNAKIFFVGIVASKIQKGTKISPVVEKAIDKAVIEVKKILITG